MENSEKAKRKIHLAFIQMMEEMPVDQIQVKALAQRAGISRSTFYVHYDSIWDVLQEIEDELFSSVYAIKKDYLSGRSDRDPMDISHDVLDYLLGNGDRIEALNCHGGEQAYLSAWTRQIQKQISRWRGIDLKDDTISSQLLAEFFIGGIQRMIHEWSSRQEEISVEELRNLFDKIHKSFESLFKELT